MERKPGQTVCEPRASKLERKQKSMVRVDLPEGCVLHDGTSHKKGKA
jgi:hypothetical protein